MSRQSYEALVEKWEKLLADCRNDPRVHAYAATELRALKRLLREAQSLKDRQAYLEREKVETTVALQSSLHQAGDLDTQIRAGLRALLGARNERLTEFGVAPLGRRRG
jgi:predicted  nucleic acid-binding Zn-ribbon protein